MKALHQKVIEFLEKQGCKLFKVFKKPFVSIQQLLCLKHEFEYERILISDESYSNEEWLKICRKCNKAVKL